MFSLLFRFSCLMKAVWLASIVFTFPLRTLTVFTEETRFGFFTPFGLYLELFAFLNNSDLATLFRLAKTAALLTFCKNFQAILR